MLIYNALLEGKELGWVRVEAPFITAVEKGEVPRTILDEETEKIDAQGAMLLPGVIDAHVHFREPGLTHKATIESESRAAMAGGVTSFIEMPNTVPPTVTVASWEDKMRRAAEKSVVNYSFMMGATADNLNELLRSDASLMPAVKVFMGSSTGNMLIDNKSVIEKIFSEQPFRVVVHAEDQNLINLLSKKYSARPDIAAHTLIRPSDACVRATEQAMEIAIRYNTRLHIAHLSTEAETHLFNPSDSPLHKQITSEVSPHHLTFTDEDYERLGARIKMNPAVKSRRDRDALRRALAEGRIDIVATDHAPHLLTEKRGSVWEAVSGAPMVQFSLPLMLDLFDVNTVIQKMSKNPALLFNIDRRGELKKGFYADMVLVEKLKIPHIITGSDVVSLCRWSPLEGNMLGHRVVRTWVNGGASPMPLKYN